jgi:hypothetical protein
LPSDLHLFARTLATKLVTEQVLFFTGAGLSVSWRHPLGSQVAEDMFKDFKHLIEEQPELLGLHLKDGSEAEVARSETERHLLCKTLNQILRSDLPLVSELLAQNKCWYIRRYITPDLTKSGFPVHFKPKRQLLEESELIQPVGVPHIVLGRLAKEGLIGEVMTVNVDTLHETGFELVGLTPVTNPKDPALRFPWVEAYQVLSDRRRYSNPFPHRRVVTLHKIHGCIEETREAVQKQGSSHKCTWNEATGACWTLNQQNHNFVFTYRELLNWRSDAWARDLVSDRVRNHHLVFAGFAVSDSVTHATLRDIYNEDRTDDSPVPSQRRKHSTGEPLLGNGKKKKCSRLRAQVITAEPNVQALNVLLAANQRDPLSDGEQLYLIKEKTSSREVELLFKEAYVEAVATLLEQQFLLRAPGLLSSWLPNESPDSIESKVRAITSFLHNSTTDLSFLYDALPASVRISWLINDSMLAAGLPVNTNGQNGQNEIRRTSYWDRFVRPQYYVPLSGAYAVTLQLLRAYQVLTEQFGGRILPDGWFRLKATPERPGIALLPVLAKRLNNWAIVRRLDIQPPSPFLHAGILELQGSDSEPCMTPEQLFASPGRLTSGKLLRTIPLTRTGLWGNSGGEEIDRCLREQLNNPEESLW